MKPSTLLLLFLAFISLSCQKEDPGPRQDDQCSYAVLDFDRLEIADAFDVTVQRGLTFSIMVNGDRRNLDDLIVTKTGNTLVMKYSDHKNRQYNTYVTITMPVLLGVDYSGAVNSRVSGFADQIDRFDASISGASVAQFILNSKEIHVLLTGASEGKFTGQGKKLTANVSGASTLSAYDYPVDQSDMIVTGASHANVSVNQILTATASGASEIKYIGDPELNTVVSGESVVRKY